jgi:queuosine precursor transporter
MKKIAPGTRSAALSQKCFRYYDLIMVAFVTILLCSNLIGAEKVITIWGFTCGAGILFFPISYFFNDILTEVYGYARSRKVVWAGFSAMAFASLMATVVIHLPPAQGWIHQKAYETVFGETPRIVLASLTAFFCGEFTNSFVLAKMKVVLNGRMLWTRTIGSTIAGEAVDSLIFYPVAFLGFWPNNLLVTVMITNYALKVLWEVIATPLTYKVVGFLKKKENEDYYDRDTNFTLFSIST